MLYGRVALAFIGHQVRRLPGLRRLGSGWLAAALLALAAITLTIWGLQPGPQRVTMGSLAGGQLPASQYWIIVTGDLSATGQSSGPPFDYRLTDPSTPLGTLDVHSPSALATGRTTVSGHLQGYFVPSVPGTRWALDLDADPIVAQEASAPIAPAIFAILGLVVLAGRGTAYPVFCSELPPSAPLQAASMSVRVRPLDDLAPDRARRATLSVRIAPSVDVDVRVDESEPLPVRLHSPTASVGALWTLMGAEPVIRARVGAEEQYIGFDTRPERDTAVAALAAMAAGLVRSGYDTR